MRKNIEIRERVLKYGSYKYRVYTREANYFFTSERDKNQFVSKYKEFIYTRVDEFKKWLHSLASFSYVKGVAKHVEKIVNAMNHIDLKGNYLDELFYSIVYAFFDISMIIKADILAESCVSLYRQVVFESLGFKSKGKYYYEIK